MAMTRVAERSRLPGKMRSASQASSMAASITSRSLPPRMIGPACRGAGTELLPCTAVRLAQHKGHAAW